MLSGDSYSGRMRGLTFSVRRAAFAVLCSAGILLLGGMSGRLRGAFDWWFLLSLAPWPVAALFFAVLRRWRYRLALNTVDAGDHLAELSDERICAILRPFGHDGNIRVSLPAPLRSGPDFVHREVRTLEEIVADRVMALMAKRSIALVDPNALILPGGVTYLRATDDWKGDVVRLLSRADVIFFLLPPHRGITTNVDYEIRAALQMDLLGRMIFVLPMPQREHRSQLSILVDHLARYFPELAGVEQVTEDDRQLVMFRPQRPSGLRFWHSKAMTADTYRSMFDDELVQVASLVRRQRDALERSAEPPGPQDRSRPN
jgi:hypothetical protein